MSEPESSALLQLVCDVSQRIMHSRIATVTIVDEGTRDDCAAMGLDDDALGDLQRSVGDHHHRDHPARRVFEGRNAVRGVNPGGDPAAIHLPASLAPVHSYLFVPVTSPSRMYGCLGFMEKIGAQAFSQEDIAVASAIGALTGVAYENARRTEQLQTQAEELGGVQHQWEKMDALGQLAGGVAHDLNNLLTPILGYARIGLDSAGDPSLRYGLQEIIKAADRATALTKQLLAFSGRHSAGTTALDLNQLLADMTTNLRSAVGAAIELTTSPAAGPVYVRADRSQLEQLIVNLVSNATDACSPGGHIRLAIEAVDVDEAKAARVPVLKRGRYVTVSVIDDGCGMSEAIKARLFEPFFTTKPRGQGTGLGLATAYGIATHHGGGILVDSELGCGSTFTLYLPQERAPQPAAERRVDSPPATSPRTVLLVEDDQAVRELVSSILERAGYNVVEAATPQDALASFDTTSVDLLLTDVVMPEMSGFDLSKALIERRPSLPVLFMSGYTDSTDAQAISGTATAFLQKPFSAQALVTRVREMCR